jgi:hypothetical protein
LFCAADQTSNDSDAPEYEVLEWDGDLIWLRDLDHASMHSSNGT